MDRYSKITNVHNYKREIVLLKSRPCAYGKCTFCDYILDNSRNINEINAINFEVLENVIGEFSILEIINSGNVFELPQATKQRIKKIIKKKISSCFSLKHTGCIKTIYIKLKIYLRLTSL